MLRKSGILAVLLALGIFGTLSASTSPGLTDPAAAPASAVSANGQTGEVGPLAFLPSATAGATSCSASPLLSIGDMGRRNLDTCITHGNTCDPRYVQDPVCCAPYHCQFVYPGVPLACL